MIWYILSCLHLEAITTVNTVNILITLKDYVMHLCDPSLSPSVATTLPCLQQLRAGLLSHRRRWPAFCQCRSVCISQGFVWMESYGIPVSLSVLVLSKFCDLSVPLHFQWFFAFPPWRFCCINMPQLVYPFNGWWATVLLTGLVCYI